MRLKVLAGVAAAIVLLVGALAVIVALRPSEFRIERSATVAAPARAVFAQVNDFPQLGGMVAVGETRPGGEELVRGRAGREGRGLFVGRQQQGR
jgi:uncharacterized membrane protein